MTKDFEDKGNNYAIHDSVNIGEVHITEEVVAIVAGLAATEVEGVKSLSGNITNELVSKLGIKMLQKGLRVNITDETAVVDLSVNIDYGYEIPVVSRKIQERVKSAIETMTGIKVIAVNIKVASVNIEAE